MCFVTISLYHGIRKFPVVSRASDLVWKYLKPQMISLLFYTSHPSTFHSLRSHLYSNPSSTLFPIMHNFIRRVSLLPCICIFSEYLYLLCLSVAHFPCQVANQLRCGSLIFRLRWGLLTIYHIPHHTLYSILYMYVCKCLCKLGIFKYCANLLPSTWHLRVCGHQAKCLPSPPTPPRHAGQPFAPDPAAPSRLLGLLVCCGFCSSNLLN